MSTKGDTTKVSDTFAARDAKTNRRRMLGKFKSKSTNFMTRLFSADQDERCVVEDSLIIGAAGAKVDLPQHSGQISPKTIGNTTSSYKEGRFGELPDGGIGVLSKMRRHSSRRLLIDKDINLKPAPQLIPKKEVADSAQQMGQKPLSTAQKQTAKYLHPCDPEPPVPKENMRFVLHTMKRLSSRRLLVDQPDTVVISNDSKKDPSDRSHSCSTKNLGSDIRPIETSSTFEFKTKSRENLDLTNLFAVFTLVDKEKTAKADAFPAELSGPVVGTPFIDRRTMMGRSFSNSAMLTPKRSNLKKQQILFGTDHQRTPRLGLERANSVKFDKIQVREYERVLGDNPAVSAGPPVSLGWKYTPERELDVEFFETERPPRRTRKELSLPARFREDMLVKQWGHTLNELKLASIESEIVKGQRKESANYHSMYMEEAMERSRERRTMASEEPDALDQLLQHAQYRVQAEFRSELFAI